MSLMFQPLRRYADFNGRASRTEFWLFQLFILILVTAFTAVLVTVALTSPQGEDPPAAFWVTALVAVLTYLVLFIPRLALIVRRLHDSDNSGFWVLISLVPCGGLVMLVFSLIPGTIGPNGHGPDPRGRPAPTTPQAAMTLESAG